MAQIGKTPGDDTGCPEASRPWVLAAAIVGSSMAFIDGTVVNVALPAIQADLRATAFQAQWVVESYALLLAALLLVGGALGDHFGRRRVFAIGVAIFAFSSVACALAASVQQLIAARAVQGLGGAMLVPGSLALISAAFPEKARGKAIGTWSGFSGITGAVGPVLGGFLVDHFSWTWAFLINVPMALLVLWICWRHVPESRGASARGGLDPWGALLATAGLGGIVYAFIEAPTQGWASAAVRAALAIGIAGSVGFVAIERRVRAPMLPLSLFRSGNFSGANLLTLLLYAALGGGLYFFPLNLIQVQGWSATAAGAALLPFILVMFALSAWAGQLVDRFGPRLPLVIGPAIAAVGFGLFALPGVGASYWSGFLPAVVVLSLGMAVTVAPLTTTVMNAVGPDLAGVASGVNNAVSRAAAVLAIAVFGAVMAWAFDAALAERLQAANASAQVTALFEGERASLAGAAMPPGVDAATAETLRRAVAEAFVAGFRWVMLLSAGLALLSAVSAWRMIGGKAGNRP
ncbi:MFS transporter [Variovorax paradoxus]|jgi:EmrB/QacA subfamily drug resistance transporter|uniref:MFS transporter n=1 Tax=Variovorax paradoxus TaxID=34073 RepID=UPI0006E5F734|nr:MFS transporter [Variovorax paradoxus]KPV02219.1 MFS transporter [Variovorax paradoxus]KPV11431.1 MFS transporter [Variovorax paradoxus]KPV15945.1 MFS transporter [Variovorax paradoxus]KPV33592.1 MFS transporter [Variovorax paradoxus]